MRYTILNNKGKFWLIRKYILNIKKISTIPFNFAISFKTFIAI